MRHSAEIKKVLFFLILFFSPFLSESQRYLWEIQTTHEVPCFAEIDSVNAPLSQNSFQLIRMQAHWYAVGNGTGLVYKRNSNGTWNRIDSTRFGGYHFGANLLVFNNSLIKYGGYGFWRNNGYFVKFEEDLGQWEIIPTNIELPTHNKLLFYDTGNNALLSFGNSRFNQVQSNELIPIDSLFRIDLKEMKWQNLGAISKACIQEFNLPTRSEIISNNQFCILLGTQQNQLPLCIDFKTMQYGKLKLSQQNSPIDNRLIQPNDSTFCVSDGSSVYLISKNDFRIVDQKLWTEIVQNAEITNPFVVYETEYLLWTSIVLGICILLFLVIKKYKTKNKHSFGPEGALINELNFLSKNRIRFKGAIYQLNELDIRHLKLILNTENAIVTLVDLHKEIEIQSEHLEISKQNVIDWIIRMNAFFTTIGMNQPLIEVQDENISINDNILISFDSK